MNVLIRMQIWTILSIWKTFSMLKMRFVEQVGIVSVGVIMSAGAPEVRAEDSFVMASDSVGNPVPDTVFLGFEGDLYDSEVIWGHQDIYKPAYIRMARRLTFEDNCLKWDFSSAEEVRVSQNIFDYVTGIWMRQNAKLASGDYVLIPEGIYFRVEPKRHPDYPSDLKTILQNMTAVKTSRDRVKSYIDGNTYIDLDVMQLAKDIAGQELKGLATADNLAKMKAALYRFYRNVKLKDGQYYCSLSKAADINVSEGVFEALLKNLKDMNTAIKKAREKGVKMDIPEVTEEYLYSLLKM